MVNSFIQYGRIVSIIEEMQVVFDQADCLKSVDEVNQVIADMAQAIQAELALTNPLVICVMNGGLVLSGQLLPLLQFPLEFDYLHATRYRENTTGADLAWIHEPKKSLKNRTILLVDDIYDEGITLREVKSYCERQGADKVYLAVLVEKIRQRDLAQNIPLDFVGMKIEDRYVFGFGMDYKGYWRNAPGIYAVKGM